jgi:hypothetical protein
MMRFPVECQYANSTPVPDRFPWESDEARFSGDETGLFKVAGFVLAQTKRELASYHVRSPH